MIDGKKIVVVLPAYNAEKTLERTHAEIPREVVDEVILVDDGSRDGTVVLARRLGILHATHGQNLGYGANQKTCYALALHEGADIVVMVHPDYQYSPRLITPMAAMIASGEYDIVLGSRILGGGTIRGGMPLYKFVGNRFLTLVQNLLSGAKLSEYHTGFRAFARSVLLKLHLGENSDDFVFDNEILVQALRFGYRIGEISCPTRYMSDSSSIPFWRSVRYGFGVLATTGKSLLHRAGLARFPFLDPKGRRLRVPAEDRVHSGPLAEEGMLLPSRKCRPPFHSRNLHR